MVRAASPFSWKQWRWNGVEIRSFRGGVPLSDRGFRYGQHLFESIAIRNGYALLAGEHLALLEESAKSCEIPFPNQLLQKLRSFLHPVRLDDGMLRIYLTVGPGAPAAPITQPNCYLAWELTQFPTSSEIETGISLTLLKQPVIASGWGLKSGNYLPHVEALQAARAAGADEGIVSDPKGRVISCAMGNLLLWMPSAQKETILCTPSPTAGARSGAVLQWVKSRMPVIEREISSTDLLKASALAVTNSRLGVMPVTLLDGEKLRDASPARTLANYYLSAHGILGKS